MKKLFTFLLFISFSIYGNGSLTQKLKEAGAKFSHGGKHLYLSSENITSEHLENLVTLKPALLDLRISEKTKITCDDLHKISNLQTLKSLQLRLPSYNSAGIIAISKLVNLEELSIRSDNKELKLPTDIFSPLKSLVNLQKLTTGGHNFPPEVLATLPDILPNLKVLDLNHTFKTNAETIKAFAKFKQLDRLNIGGNPWMPEDAMAIVGNIKFLKELGLVHTGEKHFSAIIHSLKNHQEIRRLKMAVRGSQLTDDLIPILLTMPKLEEVSFGHDKGPLTDKSIEIISKHPSLKVLTVSHPSYTDKVLQPLASSSVKVLYFDAENCTDNSLAEIKNIQGLEELYIGSWFRSPKLTDAGVEQLKSLKHIKQMRLFLHKNCSVSESALEELKKSLPNTILSWRFK